ncbi:MAG: hypothetical protein MI685_07480, partial [Chlorobiales bacterium]|nr:hypothetical protein [Chlorobiales bacterium]
SRSLVKEMAATDVAKKTVPHRKVIESHVQMDGGDAVFLARKTMSTFQSVFGLTIYHQNSP